MAEDAADGGSGAVNPNAPEALAGDVAGAISHVRCTPFLRSRVHISSVILHTVCSSFTERWAEMTSNPWLQGAMAATQQRFREGNKDAAYVPGPDAVARGGLLYRGVWSVRIA